MCPVNSTNPPDVGGGSVPSGWKKVSALKSGEKLFSIFEKISTIAYNVKWLFKWLNSINTIGEYTSVDSQGNIVRVKNSASDAETGVPFPFPIQTVVEGHELALRQLNTDRLPGKLISTTQTNNIDTSIYIPLAPKPGHYYLVLMRSMSTGATINDIFMAIGSMARMSLKNIFHMILNPGNLITAIGYSENGTFFQINLAHGAYMDISIFELFV